MAAKKEVKVRNARVEKNGSGKIGHTGAKRKNKRQHDAE